MSKKPERSQPAVPSSENRLSQQVTRRQRLTTISHCLDDDLTCHYINHDYGRKRIIPSKNYTYKQAAPTRVKYMKTPTFDKLGLAEVDNKCESLNNWLEFTLKWVPIEKHLEVRRIIDKQRQEEEELWLESNLYNHSLPKRNVSQTEIMSDIDYESLEDICSVSSWVDSVGSSTTFIVPKQFDIQPLSTRERTENCYCCTVIEDESQSENELTGDSSQARPVQELCDSREMKPKQGVTLWSYVSDHSKESAEEDNRQGHQLSQGDKPRASTERTNKGYISFWVGDPSDHDNETEVDESLRDEVSKEDKQPGFPPATRTDRTGGITFWVGGTSDHSDEETEYKERDSEELSENDRPAGFSRATTASKTKKGGISFWVGE